MHHLFAFCLKERYLFYDILQKIYLLLDSLGDTNYSLPVVVVCYKWMLKDMLYWQKCINSMAFKFELTQYNIISQPERENNSTGTDLYYQKHW